MTTSAPRRTGRKLLVAVLLLPVWLLAAELLVRGFFLVQGNAYDSAQARERLESLVRQMSQRLPMPGATPEEDAGERGKNVEVLHPYYGWESIARIEQATELAEWFATDEAEESYDVVVLGGSVGHLFGKLGADRLAERLGADPRLAGRPVRVHNQARAAFKQPQQAIVLTWLLNLGWRPDAVINLDGLNEVAVGQSNASADVHPLYPFPQWGKLAKGRRADPEAANLLLDVLLPKREGVELATRAVDAGLHRSCMLGKLVLKRVRAKRQQSTAAYRRYVKHLSRDEDDPREVRGPDRPPGVDDVRDLIVPSWAESSRILHDVCTARGIHYVHALQPTLLDAGSKPLTEEELANGAGDPPWVEGVGRGYPLLRAKGAELAAEGIAFVDASGAFADVERTLYYDVCHFGVDGCELVADVVADGFLATLPDGR